MSLPNSKRISLFSLFCGFLLLNCNPLLAAFGPQDSNSTTEVIVLGTHPGIVALAPEYSPAHLRALLIKLKPDILAVDAPANLPDSLKLAPPEIVEVVEPWAREQNKSVVPIGWNEAQFAELTTKSLQEIQVGKNRAKYLAAEDKFQRQRAELPVSIQALNSDGHHQLWRDYHNSIHEVLEKGTPWEDWNAKILENVLQVAKTNSGKRIVVVIGAAHAYYLIDALAKQDSLKPVRLDVFFPLIETEVKQAVLPRDFLVALRPLNADILPPPELQRMEGLLEQLKSSGEFDSDYHLLRGKFLLHARRPAEALTEFELLGKLDRAEVSQLDKSSKLYETGLVYTALALLQKGEPETARSRLKEALSDDKIADSTRRWAHQVMALIPPK